MNALLLCILIKSTSICVPSLGGPVDAEQFTRIHQQTCPDCSSPMVIEVFRGKRACLVALNGSVIASATLAKGSEFSNSNEFVDAMISGGVLLFTSPTVRESRKLILAQASQCLTERDAKLK